MPQRERWPRDAWRHSVRKTFTLLSMLFSERRRSFGVVRLVAVAELATVFDHRRSDSR